MTWSEHLAIGAVSTVSVLIGLCFVPVAFRIVQFIRRRKGASARLTNVTRHPCS